MMLRCGKEAHTPNFCAFKEAKCFNCGKIGHTISVCRSKRKQLEGQINKWSHDGRTKWVETGSTVSQVGSDEPVEELIWQVGATASRPYQAVIEVN